MLASPMVVNGGLVLIRALRADALKQTKMSVQ
jgi:hypothetical protein